MLEGRGSRPKGYIDEKWNFKLYIYIYFKVKIWKRNFLKRDNQILTLKYEILGTAWQDNKSVL
jgi:hypothetical protein